MARLEFPDAPISESEWRKRRAAEEVIGELTPHGFSDDACSVESFMQTRESCDICERQLDYDDQRIIAIEVTGEPDNVWWVFCPACGSLDAHAAGKTLVYRVRPVHSLSPGITLLHNEYAV